MIDQRDWKQPSRYFESLGMSVAERSDGRATLTYAFDEAYGNRKGDVQGGVLASLIDIAMSESIRSTLVDAEFRGLSTITMTVNYLDVANGDQTAQGKAERVGKTTAFASAEIHDKAGKLVATGQGAFRIIR